MSVDQYSICPCGSGKKIKFCKCKDSIHEMERVLKMMSGGQMVAALDRLNQILDEHPDAAWCLAIKGRLLLELKEDEALEENAERFIRLQPSNPLALTQQAAYRGVRGETQLAAESLLQALAESSSGVDSFVLDVASVLALSFAQDGNLLSSRCFAGLALTAKGYENENLASMAITQVNRSREISNMLKGVPTLEVKPKDPSVRERYNEAASLLRANQILLAESKFESLARSHPQEEGVLRGLLVCAVWRGDAPRQAELLRKLSAIETVSWEQRARDLALAALLEPEQPLISTPCADYSWDVADLELLEQELISSGRTIQLPTDVLRSASNSDEHDVPPRSGFQLLDREIGQINELPDSDSAPIVVTSALLYGKQTDRSARIELLSVCAIERQQSIDFFTGLSAVSGEPRVEESRIPLMSAASVHMPIMRIKATQADVRKLQLQLTNREFVGRVMSTPMKMFGDKTPQETLDDQAFELQRTALARIVESYDVMYEDPQVLVRLRDALKVEALPQIAITSDEQLYALPVDNLYRVSVADASTELLLILLERAQAFHCTLVMRDAARGILDSDLGDDATQIRPLAYLSLVDATLDDAEALQILKDAKTWAKENKVNHSPMLLSECLRRIRAGDSEGFQSALQETLRDFGNDPNVMARLQQMLVELGLINPDGTPRKAPSKVVPMDLPADPAAAASSAGPGLWTPDSSNAPQTATGVSKLWVPGNE